MLILACDFSSSSILSNDLKLCDLLYEYGVKSISLVSDFQLPLYMFYILKSYNF